VEGRSATDVGPDNQNEFGHQLSLVDVKWPTASVELQPLLAAKRTGASLPLAAFGMEWPACSGLVQRRGPRSGRPSVFSIRPTN